MIQFALASIALAVTATLLVTGMSVRGESRESAYDGICSTAVWPRVPANCLEDGRRHNVRLVESDAQVAKAEPEAKAGDLTNPPQQDAQAIEDCCGMDEDFSFRGYTVELWTRRRQSRNEIALIRTTPASSPRPTRFRESTISRKH
jgi:hypothetical protein